MFLSYCLHIFDLLTTTKTNTMYTFTEIILPIIFTCLFIYWVGTIARLIITLLFNKD